MEIETRTENKNKEQRKNKLGSMSFIKCIPKAKKNKRKFTLFHPQMGPKNKTSFVQKRATNNLQLFTIRKHTQNSSVFPLTNKTTKSTKPTMTPNTPCKCTCLQFTTHNKNKTKQKEQNNQHNKHHNRNSSSFLLYTLCRFSSLCIVFSNRIICQKITCRLPRCLIIIFPFDKVLLLVIFALIIQNFLKFIDIR